MWIHLLALQLISGAGGDVTPVQSDFPGVDFRLTDAETPKWWAKSGQKDEAEPVPVKKPRQPQKAREEAEKVIREVAADQVARGDVPKSARFAEVRSAFKTLEPDATAFNWPALYERVYSQLLTLALQRELAREDQIQDDALALLLLIEA